MQILNSIWFMFLAFGFLLFAGVSGQSQNNKHSRQQKISPLFDLRPTITIEERKAQNGLVRSYLWDLWQTQTKGAFNVRQYSLEGNPTNCQYLVEPNKMGGWQVVSKCKESICPFISRVRCREYLKVYVSRYDSVERRAIGYNESTATPKLPDDQRYPSGEFILILKNSKSGTSTEL